MESGIPWGEACTYHILTPATLLGRLFGQKETIKQVIFLDLFLLLVYFLTFDYFSLAMYCHFLKFATVWGISVASVKGNNLIFMPCVCMLEINF